MKDNWQTFILTALAAVLIVAVVSAPFWRDGCP